MDDRPRLASRTELVKARIFDSIVLVLMACAPNILLVVLASSFDESSILGLLCMMAVIVLVLFAVCGMAGWWFGDQLANQGRTLGYRRYHLRAYYGDTREPVGLGGQILMAVLSPIDLAFGYASVNAKTAFVWTRRIRVFYIPPHAPLPDGRIARDGGPPIEPNWARPTPTPRTRRRTTSPSPCPRGAPPSPTASCSDSAPPAGRRPSAGARPSPWPPTWRPPP
jgi:hypothetical protein